VGSVADSGSGLLRSGIASRAGGKETGDIQQRSGQPVHERWLHGGAPISGCAHQHGWTRPGVRQHHGGALVAECEIRGGVSEGLCDTARGAVEFEGALCVLQRGASAPVVVLRDAGGGLQRRKERFQGAESASRGCNSSSRGGRLPRRPSHRTGLVGHTSGSLGKYLTGQTKKVDQRPAWVQ
jgi:hypothetical protein